MISLAANKAVPAAMSAVVGGPSPAFNSLLPALFTGSQHLVPSVPHDDTHTEERIAQILNDAQKAMHMKKAMEQVKSNRLLLPKFVKCLSYVPLATLTN